MTIATAYRETTARLREVNAALGSDEAQSDPQYYEQLADEQIALMDQAAGLLAQSMVDETNAKSNFPLSTEAARDLARDTLVRAGLVW